MAPDDVGSNPTRHPNNLRGPRGDARDRPGLESSAAGIPPADPLPRAFGEARQLRLAELRALSAECELTEEEAAQAASLLFSKAA